MKVKMKSTHESAPDGIHVGKFEKGKTYDLPEVAAKRFITKGWASATKKVEPEETPVAEEPEETKVVEPPEIKEEALPETLDGSTSQDEETEDEEPPEEPKEKAENKRHKK